MLNNKRSSEHYRVQIQREYVYNLPKIPGSWGDMIKQFPSSDRLDVKPT